MAENQKDIGRLLRKGIEIYCAWMDSSTAKVCTEITSPHKLRDNWGLKVDFGEDADLKLAFIANTLEEAVQNFYDQVVFDIREYIKEDDARRKRVQFMIGEGE